MSVQVLCPHCGVIAEWHRPPVIDCAACHSPYPAQLRVSTERALERSLAPKPMLLFLGQLGSALGGLVFLGTLATAPFNAANYTINNQPVSGAEFLRRAGFLWAAIAAVLLVIAFGLWRERAWVRPLMVLYWLLLPLGSFIVDDWDTASILSAFFFCGVAAAIAAWYLYRRPSVRAYFDARSASIAAHDA
jgi:hypothetical protein